MCAPVLFRFGTEEQKRKYLPRIYQGEDFWCQGYSEPGSGSDLASLKTRAVRDGDHYVVNGQKIWTSLAGGADYCWLAVRTDPKAAKHAGISMLIVDMKNTPGIRIDPRRPPRVMLAYRNTASDELFPVELTRGWTSPSSALPERTATISLSPEYCGAILTKSGTANDPGGEGMTSDLDVSGNTFRTYYEWSSDVTGAIQSYDVFVQWRVPHSFKSFQAGTNQALQLEICTEENTTTNNKIDVTLQKDGAATVLGGTVAADRFAYGVCQRCDRIEEDAQRRDRDVVLVDGVHACPTDGVGVDQPELRQRLQCLLDRPQAVVIADECMDLSSRQGSVGA
jgi:hypothetical protein